MADLYRRHRDGLLKRALRQVRDPAAAEDAVHEALTDFLEKVDPTGIDNLGAYLGRMVDNRIRQEHRKVGREVAQEALPEAGGASDLSDDLDAHEGRRIIQESLVSLKPRQRKALLLDSESLSVPEIARILGMTSHNCSALLHRARCNLRREAFKKGLLPALVPMLIMRTRARLRDCLNVLRRHAEVGGAGLLQAVVLAAMVAAPISSPALPGAEFLPDVTVELLSDKQIEARATALAGSVRNRSPESIRQATLSPSPTLNVQIPGNHAGIGPGKERESPEPSPEDQLIAMVRDPGSIPLPRCEGKACPSLP